MPGKYRKGQFSVGHRIHFEVSHNVAVPQHVRDEMETFKGVS
jgi:hypothetical protein